MKNKFIAFITIFMLVLGSTMTCYASDVEPIDDDMMVYSNSASHFEWEYDGCTYFGHASTSTYGSRAYPLYVTWDGNGIKFMVNKEDLSSSSAYLVIKKIDSSGTTSNVGSYKMTSGSNDVNEYLEYTMLSNIEIGGLQFSSLSNFRNTIDMDSAVLYYLATDEVPFSEAVNFTVPPLEMTGTLMEVVEGSHLRQSLTGYMTSLVPYGIGLLALLVLLPMLRRVFKTFLRG